MNEEGALRVVHDEIVAPSAPWSARVRRDQVLRIVDLEGEQGVDFLCYDAADPRERYYAPNTIKKSGTLRLTKGHALYSDLLQGEVAIGLAWQPIIGQAGCAVGARARPPPGSLTVR